MTLPLHGQSSSELLDMIDWYRRCLEDVNDRRVVRGLTEAKLGYDRAMRELRVLLHRDSSSEERKG